MRLVLRDGLGAEGLLPLPGADPRGPSPRGPSPRPIPSLASMQDESQSTSHVPVPSPDLLAMDDDGELDCSIASRGAAEAPLLTGEAPLLTATALLDDPEQRILMAISSLSRAAFRLLARLYGRKVSGWLWHHGHAATHIPAKECAG